jgi:HEPN domain-containing protein
MDDEKRHVVEAWLAKAEHDLTTARVMLREGVEYADIVCYHSQQAVEKNLKAFLVLVDHDFPQDAQPATASGNVCTV